MKKLINICLVLALAFTFNACTGEDNTVNDVFDGVTNGAVLRTISVISGEIAIGAVDPQFFSVEVEEQDNQDGALLESVDVYVTFTDASAGTSTTEAFAMNIDASEFSTDTPFGLPRTTITMTFAEMLAIAGVLEADTFGGDSFSVRLALNLTDGRTFTDTNTGGVVTGGFFSSPFRYNVNLVCLVPDDYMIGTYLMERISTDEDPFFPGFGQAMADQMVTISGSGATREFDFVYYPSSFALDYHMTWTLSCGNLFAFGEWPFGTLSCNGGANSIEQCNTDPPDLYDLANDTVFEVDLIDFCDDGGCGTGGYLVTMRFTLQ